MFLDACYDEEDEDEKMAYDDSMETLYKLLESFKGLETSQVNNQACI